jgi:hypothetical protein
LRCIQLGLSFCELREAVVVALLCYYQLNSFYLVCNMFVGTLFMVPFVGNLDLVMDN